MEAIYCSPLERTCETAEQIGDQTGLTPTTLDELQEIDFGEWMGKPLAELRENEKWRQFNSFRSGSRAPSGELMLETQLRIVRCMEAIREHHPNGCVALVSHGDVIKAAVAYFLGVSLDLFQRIEISPASVSIIALADYGPWVLGVNHTGELPRLP